MKQHVGVTLKLNLWLDASMDEDEIVTHIQASLLKAFGEELEAMLNPVEILSVKEEAELYGEDSESGELNSPWTLHFDRDGTQDIGIIRDKAGPSPSPWTYEYSPFRLTQEADEKESELAAFEVFDANGDKVFDTNEDTPCELQEANARLAATAPRLLASLITSANLLADFDESEGEEGEAYREALAAIAEATGREDHR